VQLYQPSAISYRVTGDGGILSGASRGMAFFDLSTTDSATIDAG